MSAIPKVVDLEAWIVRLIDESKHDFRRPNVTKTNSVLSKICARGCNSSKQIFIRFCEQV